MAESAALKICRIYPDILSSPGDAGNITCLRKRLEWRGIPSSVTELRLSERLDLSEFDLFFIGGQKALPRNGRVSELILEISPEIRAAVEDGKVFLALGGGYQLLGGYYQTRGGDRFELLGAVDFYTVEGGKRMTGNFLFDTGKDCAGVVVGFENHDGLTFLGGGSMPLGIVTRGFGNNGEDKTEGCRFKNVFASYAGGALLPKNPRLADFILQTALSEKFPAIILNKLDDGAENTAYNYIIEKYNSNLRMKSVNKKHEIRQP